MTYFGICLRLLATGFLDVCMVVGIIGFAILGLFLLAIWMDSRRIGQIFDRLDETPLREADGVKIDAK